MTIAPTAARATRGIKLDRVFMDSRPKSVAFLAAVFSVVWVSRRSWTSVATTAKMITATPRDIAIFPKSPIVNAFLLLVNLFVFSIRVLYDEKYIKG